MLTRKEFKSPKEFLQHALSAGISHVTGEAVPPESIAVQPTRPEFHADYTFLLFPYAKAHTLSLPELSIGMTKFLREHCPEVGECTWEGGFLNITLRDAYWTRALDCIPLGARFGLKPKGSTGQRFMIEYSSPNTNKPLHLGHIRNILLGWSMSQLLEAVGHEVVKVNLVNDRGIHICKSMVAWLEYGEGETPESAGVKGDHLVGKYYVQFDKVYKAQVAELQAGGLSEEEAKSNAPIFLAAQELLRKWERNDGEVYALWERMNGWVYSGFDATYETMGVGFDKVYYESDTYLLGKSIVEQGLEKGVLYRRADGSVWADLTGDGLDEKLLLRADGTSVYMTQDLGTAVLRAEEYTPTRMLYVVGNEQEYHFQVLQLLLNKLGYSDACRIKHISYGMVNLPEGKMKSREGTVVDADDLMQDVIDIARETSDSLGKLADASPAELDAIFHSVGLGALKYFILKVDPTKNMTFNPKESIDFNGNTGPFIQYTHARACSIVRKREGAVLQYAVEADNEFASVLPFSLEERRLLRRLYGFEGVVEQAAREYSPAQVANYLYDLAKEFNQFYHECPIGKELKVQVQSMRLQLTRVVIEVLRTGLSLLGIDAPEKM